MKYILICVVLILVLILTSSVKYQEPLMQFDEIIIVPLTTFPKKEAEITFAPVPKATPLSEENTVIPRVNA